MTSDIEILKRLYHDYTKKYVKKILLSVFFTVLLAGSTSAIAYLLDPAIKKLFIEQKKRFNFSYTRFDYFGFSRKRIITIFS